MKKITQIYIKNKILDIHNVFIYVVYVRNINDLHLNVMPHVKFSKGSRIVKCEDNNLSTSSEVHFKSFKNNQNRFEMHCWFTCSK